MTCMNNITYLNGSSAFFRLDIELPSSELSSGGVTTRRAGVGQEWDSANRQRAISGTRASAKCRQRGVHFRRWDLPNWHLIKLDRHRNKAARGLAASIRWGPQGAYPR
jgi:hypothetical protein